MVGTSDLDLSDPRDGSTASRASSVFYSGGKERSAKEPLEKNNEDGK